ncbi:hypothetical protein BC835DRAFT_410348 [Cytidiella melzeri]|nr:hypothetical protein BC835DRAFT_410348 [Cytidiella melzeri]
MILLRRSHGGTVPEPRASVPASIPRYEELEAGHEPRPQLSHLLLDPQMCPPYLPSLQWTVPATLPMPLEHRPSLASCPKQPEMPSTVDYFDVACQDPTEKQRGVLLNYIHQIPGGEWYTASHLRQWFIGRNNQLKRDEQIRKRKAAEGEAEPAKVVLSPDQFLWPSLTASKIEMLSTLLYETPDPAESYLQMWSRALGVELQHLENWVQFRQIQLKLPQLRHRDSDAALELPTPEGIASPELHSPSVFTSSMSPFVTPNSILPSAMSPFVTPSSLCLQMYVGYDANTP